MAVLPYPTQWITIPVNTTPNSSTSNGSSNSGVCSSSNIQIDFNLDWSGIGLDWAVEKKKQEKVLRGNAEGYECEECKDFYPMAELNQPSGASTFYTFKCYSCREGLRTIFEKLDNGE